MLISRSRNYIVSLKKSKTRIIYTEDLESRRWHSELRTYVRIGSKSTRVARHARFGPDITARTDGGVSQMHRRYGPRDREVAVRKSASRSEGEYRPPVFAYLRPRV